VSTQRITRDDIEQSIRAIQTGMTDRVRSRKATVVQAATVASVVVVLVVFLLGRRTGRKRNTIVEIRRV
jgi:hypothetical protein